MAYYTNPYYGGYYMMYPQQQMIEQQNLNVQPVQTSKAMNSYFVWVQGEAGAKSYPVAPGTTLPLFDSEGDYVYFKSVDSNGVPMPLVTKVISDLPSTKVVEEETKVDMSEYVTKEVYDELSKKYGELEARIIELETKPTSSFNSTFTGNTFNNTRKDGKENGSKFTL